MAINLENVLSSIGTIEELNNIQNYFNTVCENCRTKLIVEAKAKELSSSPLLYLMEAFSSLSPELFATKQGRTIIRQYIDECRKNDAVKAVYTVYETIKEADKNTADYTLLNEILIRKVLKRVQKSLEVFSKMPISALELNLKI